MDITRYFLSKPVTTIIINFMIAVIGLWVLKQLPIREYPDFKVPIISVITHFSSASPELVENSVTNILEDKLAGIEGLDTIESSSSSNSSYIELRFHSNESLDRALIAIKDAISSIRAILPEGIKEPIVETSKTNQGPPFMAACIVSENMDVRDLTHLANIELKNAYKSIQGVSEVRVRGRPYTYKIIIDHQKLYNFGINIDEIVDAISNNDTSFPGGSFQKTTPITIASHLSSEKDFKNIIIRKGTAPIYLKDIAQVSLDLDETKLNIKINGKPGICLGFEKSSESNPLTVSNAIHKQTKLLNNTLPDGVKIELALDQASFIRSSINNIKSSIIEAILLVLIIVLIFLGDIKATFIPIITIPISLLGAMIFLNFFGFSLNVITLLAMVLAVGLVVDDAIIVLENIARHIEIGETPANAALKGANEIFFAVIAMTFTLASVYLPILFISGLTGHLFVEFATALAGSVIMSGIVAITLSPLMCKKILSRKRRNYFIKTDLYLNKVRDLYIYLLKKSFNYPRLIFISFILCSISVVIFYKIIPSQTVPEEDRGIIGAFIPPIPDDNEKKNEANINLVESLLNDIPGVNSVITFSGEFGGNVVLTLNPREKRKYNSNELLVLMRNKLSSLPSFDAWPWSISSGLPGMDNIDDSSKLSLVISTTESYVDLFKNIENLIKKADQDGIVEDLYQDLKIDNLGYNVVINEHILSKLSLNKKQVAKIIATFFSGDKSLKFKKDGILYPIEIELDNEPWTLNELYVTNNNKRISLGTFASLEAKSEPKNLKHFNRMRSSTLSKNLIGDSNLSSQIEELYNFANENLPPTYKKTWKGVAKVYEETSKDNLTLFFMSVLFIYAILAIQFESFVDPLIILFTIPLACFGSYLGLFIFNSNQNIYTQVGIITLIGLITKHGIMIVEFANQLLTKGFSLNESIEESVSIRLRPILMTTLAMVCGSIPLILSSSSGSEARFSIGIVILFGLMIGTIFTLFILPSVYYYLKKIQLK